MDALLHARSIWREISSRQNRTWCSTLISFHWSFFLLRVSTVDHFSVSFCMLYFSFSLSSVIMSLFRIRCIRSTSPFMYPVARRSWSLFRFRTVLYLLHCDYFWPIVVLNRDHDPKVFHDYYLRFAAWKCTHQSTVVGRRLGLCRTLGRCLPLQ